MPRISTHRWAAALLSTSAVPLYAQDKPPVVLSPSSPWNVNYADDSCRIGRVFADGKGMAVFYIDQFEPGPMMNVLVASKAFEHYAGSKVVARFGPGGAERTIDQLISADLGKVGPAIMVNSFALVDGGTTEVADLSKSEPAPLTELKPATAEQAQAITWFEVKRGSRPAVRFALGPMRDPMAALRKCTEELLTHWGIDVAAHRTLTKKPTPSGNPGSWVSNSDYPMHLASQGVEGIIQFRLLIDEAGKVTSCHIQQSTRPAEFDKKVCDVMSKRARFDPALDAQGKPIKSYWRSQFRFVIN